MRRRAGAGVLAGVFALLCLADVWQLAQAAQGRHPDPPGLFLTHGMTSVLAGLAAVGSWRERRWAALAALGWGAVTAGMFVALGPVLDTPPAERPTLWVSAAVVAIGSLAAGWYLHRPHRAPAA